MQDVILRIRLVHNSKMQTIHMHKKYIFHDAWIGFQEWKLGDKHGVARWNFLGKSSPKFCLFVGQIFGALLLNWSKTLNLTAPNALVKCKT